MIKKGDKLEALVNAFTGEVKICVAIEDERDGQVMANHGAKNEVGEGLVYLETYKCKLLPSNAVVGTLVRTVEKIDPFKYYSSKRLDHYRRR
jgi:hypothetical protein